MSKFLFVAFLLASTIISAQDIFFNGFAPSGSDQWHNPLNWNPQRLPTADDIVGIGNQNVVVLSGDDVTIKGLIISARATLTINDPDVRLDIIGSPEEGIRMFLRANLVVNQGTVSIRNTVGDGIYIEDKSTIINRDTLLISSFEEDGIHMFSDASIDNSGALFIDQLNGSSALLGINGVDGTLTNQETGHIVVSTCQNNSTSAIQITPGVLFEDRGELLVHEINCN